MKIEGAEINPQDESKINEVLTKPGEDISTLDGADAGTEFSFGDSKEDTESIKYEIWVSDSLDGTELTPEQRKEMLRKADEEGDLQPIDGEPFGDIWGGTSGERETLMDDEQGPKDS